MTKKVEVVDIRDKVIEDYNQQVPLFMRVLIDALAKGKIKPPSVKETKK